MAASKGGHDDGIGGKIRVIKQVFDKCPALKLESGEKAKLHVNLNFSNLPSERPHIKSLPLNLSRRRSPMAFLSDSGVLEGIAVTLAVAMMLGPLVPYAIIGRRQARQRVR